MSRWFAFVPKRFLLGLVLFAVLAVGALPVKADIAPPQPPVGGNVYPEDPTEVAMLAEFVEIEVQPLQPADPTSNFSGDWLQARVKASFIMRNEGSADERIEVRFPLANLQGWGDGYGNYPEIEDFTVRLDGKVLETQRVTTPNPFGAGDPPIPWAAFIIKFPAGKKQLVEVIYTLKSTGYAPLARLDYIFETGAGWRDPIGSAEITLVLPYPANAQNVLLDVPWGKSIGRVDGNTVVWLRENFEPTMQDNFSVTVLLPDVWQALDAARAAVKQSPQDVMALLAWAEASFAAARDGHRGAFRYDAAGYQLGGEGLRALNTALDVAPDNPQVRAAAYDWVSANVPWGIYDLLPDDPRREAVLAFLQRLLTLPNAEQAQVDAVVAALTTLFPQGVPDGMITVAATVTPDAGEQFTAPPTQAAEVTPNAGEQLLNPPTQAADAYPTPDAGERLANPPTVVAYPSPDAGEQLPHPPTQAAYPTPTTAPGGGGFCFSPVALIAVFGGLGWVARRRKE
ncbi:MAG: hypothetical protein OHK0052_20230 [Anaerolineales bacterium]